MSAPHRHNAEGTCCISAQARTAPVVSSPGADSPDGALADVTWTGHDGTVWTELCAWRAGDWWRLTDASPVRRTRVVKAVPVRLWGPPLADQLAARIEALRQDHGDAFPAMPHGEAMTLGWNAAILEVLALIRVSVRSGEQQ